MTGKRTFRPLSLYERERISVYRRQGYSIRKIAEQLGRSHSTISREFKRNFEPHPDMRGYIPCFAELQSKNRKQEAGVRLRLKSLKIQEFVKSCMEKLRWSPEIIASQIPKKFPDMSISYESIYQFIYSTWTEGIQYLARRHPKRYSKDYKRRRKAPPIPNRVSIEERPEEINQRAEPGHWETDSIVSSKTLASLCVLYERSSRFLRLDFLDRKTAKNSSSAICNMLSGVPKFLRKSITYDNGSENYYHEAVNQKLGTKSYFCAPYHSWEKGGVENINGLIRRFIPKKMDLSKVTRKMLKRIEHLINTRPRKCLGWKTPLEVFSKMSGASPP